MQADFFAGTYLFPDEIMFECKLSELTDSNAKISKIQACYLCDTDYQSTENNDSIELIFFFTVVTLFEYKCDGSQLIETGIKKINCKKRLLLSKNQFADHITETNTRKFFINNLCNTNFVTQSLNNGEERLIVSATIKGILLLEYHYSFWICEELDLKPPTKLEAYDWKNILENISIRDTVVLFENLLTLFKKLSDEKLDKQINRPEKIMDREPELYNRISKLTEELNNKDYIINGLLKCIYNAPFK